MPKAKYQHAEAAERKVRALELVRKGMFNKSEVAKAVGLSPSTVYNWFEDEVFAKSWESAKLTAQAAQQIKLSKNREKTLKAQTQDQFELFIEVWRATKSRVEACEVSGIIPLNLRRHLDPEDELFNERFQEEYQKVQSEILLEIEDARLGDALADKRIRGELLRGVDVLSGKKITVANGEETSTERGERRRLIAGEWQEHLEKFNINGGADADGSAGKPQWEDDSDTPPYALGDLDDDPGTIADKFLSIFE